MFVPLISLIGFWIGGPRALFVISLGMPFIFWRFNKATVQNAAEPAEEDTFEKYANTALKAAQRYLRKTACLVVEIDDFELLLERYGQSATDRINTATQHRLERALRDCDTVVNLGHGQFGIVLSPIRQMTSAVALQMAARMQTTVQQSVALDTLRVYITASVGFCLDSMIRAGDGKTLTDAAALALRDARRHKPSAIRSYSPNLDMDEACESSLLQDVARAMEHNEFCAWFQPQICTDTGAVCGFEALARWNHPISGIVAPNEFLPLIRSAGKSDQLTAKILHDALAALAEWDRAGFCIQTVGVNFSSDDLRDPNLVTRIQWHLDQHEISPERLCIEILETVMATSADDTVIRNIGQLAELGCKIDLDDFGTGHASISSIRRFAVQRLKVDRSFITKVDSDIDQQRMVNAILLMAEQLNLEVLAEGVETSGEHTILAQLGCKYVQGFGLARPMPFAQTVPWLEGHLERIQAPPQITRRSG